MPLFYILFFVLGLALFLLGMHILTKALEKLSGGMLQTKMTVLTKSKMRGVFFGMCITAFLQSSSAVTVMLVGLVNAGILTLQQTVGVIMGANVGTTATAWILSAAGLAKAPAFSWMNPLTIAAAALIMGVFFGLVKRKKGIAAVLCGFALLMYGMHLMSSALLPLKDIPQTAQFLTLFSNPFYGLFAGTAVTALLQSSSASVGVLQALSLTGTVTFASAVPIVMGQNIGTCVTALLSCIGADTNAKRTAFVHLYFNVAGSLLLLAVFYGLTIIFRFSFLQLSVQPPCIALIHTVFNLLSTVVLYPFSGWLVWLAKRSIR